MNNGTLTFALFGNTYQKEKSANIKEIVQDIVDLGGRIIIEHEFAEFLKDSVGLCVNDCCVFDSVSDEIDFALSIGGDGTFLKTAQQVGRSSIPIIGVNTGRLGFISDVSPVEAKTFFRNIFEGKHCIEERSLLQCSFHGEKLSQSPFALNEVAILKHDMSSMISICTYVNDNYLATYQADGLIISTPTGSTGYSLSVGGPIISPESKSLIISPVAAHSLSFRPFVLNDDVKVSLEIKSRSHNYMVAIDGRSESFCDTTTVDIFKAPYSIKIVRSAGHSFFATLRNKLLWGADKR